MKTSYDSYGWYTKVKIEERNAEVNLPIGDWSVDPVVGQDWPNFTGVEWVLIPYSIPVHTPTKEEINAPILSRLDEIDKLTDSPRARREIAIGQLTWVKTLNDEAVVLRSQLEK